MPVSVLCETQEKLMDVHGGAISLSQMCNEPCFVSVTFGLIDHEQRPLHMQGRFPFTNATWRQMTLHK